MKKFAVIFVILISLVAIVVLLTFSLFPKKYRSEIEKYAEEYNLNSSLVASVINIESGYDDNSVSSAGAIGLMQLLPNTAFDCAERLGISITDAELFEKDINIKLGCYYLRYLLNLFDENLVNTLCAYNWGYGNVCNWIALGNVDETGTIINIPIKETQNYIRKFKVCNFVYEKLYKYNEN